MSYQRERDEFIHMMSKEGVPLDIVRKTLRDASHVQRYAVQECNVGLTDDERARADRAETRITERLAPFYVEPVFSGDPRGACVKLKVPSGRTDDWGHTGLCVPTREY